MPAEGEVATRVATQDDVAAVCDFGATHIPPHYEPLIGTTAAAGQVRDWWSPRVIAQAIGDRAMILAESEDRLIGVAQVDARAQPPTLYKLYVHPAWRGRAVGRILLDAVLGSLPRIRRVLRSSTSRPTSERGGSTTARASRSTT